jgi:hypothetical protein
VSARATDGSCGPFGGTGGHGQHPLLRASVPVLDWDCWTQPDPPLSSTHPTKVEYAATREAADRPPRLTDIPPIRLTTPFLSRFLTECSYETLRACKQMTNRNIQLSSGVEFNPASLVANDMTLPSVHRVARGAIERIIRVPVVAERSHIPAASFRFCGPAADLARPVILSPSAHPPGSGASAGGQGAASYRTR